MVKNYINFPTKHIAGLSIAEKFWHLWLNMSLFKARFLNWLVIKQIANKKILKQHNFLNK